MLHLMHELEQQGAMLIAHRLDFFFFQVVDAKVAQFIP